MRPVGFAWFFLAGLLAAVVVLTASAARALYRSRGRLTIGRLMGLVAVAGLALWGVVSLRAVRLPPRELLPAVGPVFVYVGLRTAISLWAYHRDE